MGEIKGLAETVLFDGEADEYASIINYHAICHKDCMEILNVAKLLKNKGVSNENIKRKLLELLR